MKFKSITTVLIQILIPATKPPKSSCRDVKVPKICSETIIKTKVQSHRCFGFKSIYSMNFAFNRANRINFVSQWHRYAYAMKKTRISW